MVLEQGHREDQQGHYHPPPPSAGWKLQGACPCCLALCVLTIVSTPDSSGGSTNGLVAARVVAVVRACVSQKMVTGAAYSTKVLLVDFCSAF